VTGLYVAPQTGKLRDECVFYHVMEIPGHGLLGESWDLRAGVDDYLGHVPLANQRVLEIGPASGFVTFHMERQGAEVVSVELGPDSDWDVVPHARLDVARILEVRRAGMQMIRNSFWFAHERLGSRARVHHGTAYELPDELGRFDLAILGSVLLHMRDPLRALERCARLSDALVITETYSHELGEGPVARLYPTVDSSQWDTWWSFTPQLLKQFLEVLGFRRVTVTHHSQTFVNAGAAMQIPMVTLVARR